MSEYNFDEFINKVREIPYILAGSTETEKTANRIRDELEVVSPRDTGLYSSSWVVKKAENGYIVTNTCKVDDIYLSQLLEYGHIDKTGSYVAPQKHIFNVYNKHMDTLFKKAVEELNGKIR